MSIGRPKVKLDHGYIKKEYVDGHKRVSDIAKSLNVGVSIIRRHLQESGVTMRKRGWGYNVLPEKQLTVNQYEFFDGLMLSDGSIARRGVLNHRHSQGNDYLSCAFKYMEFAEYIKSQLSLAPEVHRKVHISDRYKSGYCVQYGILSSANIFFTQERDRWYPEGVKIIPKDCRLTPTSLNIMYLGDGYITKDSPKRKAIYICLHSFEREDIQLVIDHLDSINIKASIYASGEVRISSYNTADFLDYIGPCPVECYKYKWDWQIK